MFNYVRCGYYYLFIRTQFIFVPPLVLTIVFHEGNLIAISFNETSYYIHKYKKNTFFFSNKALTMSIKKIEQTLKIFQTRNQFLNLLKHSIVILN